MLGNAQAPGYPIVYCSDGFCELTGHLRAQVCLIFFGTGTATDAATHFIGRGATILELSVNVFYSSMKIIRINIYQGRS